MKTGIKLFSPDEMHDVFAEWNRCELDSLQAQRDYFSAHTYRRIDKEGVFHTHWKE